MSLTSMVNIGEDYDTLSHKLGYRLEDLILQKLSSKSVITIGVSGGSMIDLLALMLPRLQLPWARLRIFFVDEGFVPFTSDVSTYGNYQAKLFRQLPIIEQNIIKINPNLSTVEQCAEDYQKQLENLLNEDEVCVHDFSSHDINFELCFRYLILLCLVWDLMEILQVFFLIIQL